MDLDAKAVDKAHTKHRAAVKRAGKGKAGRSPLPHFGPDKEGRIVARTPPPDTQKPRVEKPLVPGYEPGATEEADP